MAPVLGSLDLAAALLVLAAGAGKLRAPAPATAMLRRALPGRLRFAARPGAVRVAGLVEFAVAGAVVLSGTRVALALLAAAYLGFLAISIRAVAAGASTSCGCFGRSDTPVGTAHLVLNGLALAVVLAGVARPPGAWGGLLHHAALPGAIGLAQAALLAALGYLAITAAPALAAERRRSLP